jgi:hypothetical protein
VVGVQSVRGGSWLRCSCSARDTSATCIERSTKTVWSSMCCSTNTATRPVPRSSFARAIERTGVIPHEVVSDQHQPYIKAVATTCPGVLHIRTGLHRARGEATRAVERGHVPTRDRLRNSRGVKPTETGQRFLEGSEAIRHLRRRGAPGAGHLVPGPARHVHVRQAVAVIHMLGRGLRRS